VHFLFVQSQMGWNNFKMLLAMFTPKKGSIEIAECWLHTIHTLLLKLVVILHTIYYKFIFLILSHFHAMIQNAKASFHTLAGEETEHTFRCRKWSSCLWTLIRGDEIIKNHWQDSDASYGNNLSRKNVSKLVKMAV